MTANASIRRRPTAGVLSDALDLSLADAQLLCRVVDAALDGEDLTELAERQGWDAPWADYYHPPSPEECALLLADRYILDTHGVESVDDSPGESTGTVRDYCNTGDSYAATLVLERGKVSERRSTPRRFLVAAWGDLVE